MTRSALLRVLAALALALALFTDTSVPIAVAAGQPTGAVAAKDRATAAIVDVASLIASRPYDASYTRLSPLLSSSYVILAGQAVPGGQTATYPGEFAWHNSDSHAMSGTVNGVAMSAFRGRPFTLPTGVAAGGIRLALYDLGQVAYVGATGAVALEVWDSLGITRWSTTSCTVGPNLTACKTSALTGSWLVDGGRYQARIAVANGGTQASFWASRFSVEPVILGPCGLPAGGFVRLDANRQLRGQPTFPDVWSHPDNPDQTVFARMQFATSAPTICVEVREGGLLDYAGANAPATYRVDVSGQPAQLFTPSARRQNNFTLATVGGGSAGSVAPVRLVGGTQTLSAYLVAAPVPRGEYLVAVYVSSSAYLLAQPPDPPVWSVVGDSKIIWLPSYPPLNSQAALIEKRGWTYQWSGIGGEELNQYVTAASVAGAWPLGHVLCGDPLHAPRVAEVELARNDYTAYAPSTVNGWLTYGLDVTHNQCPGAVILRPQVTKEAPDTFNGTAGETIRAAERANITTQGVYDPSGVTRTNWLKYVEAEGFYTSLECAVNASGNPLATCADGNGTTGVHPGDRGNELLVRGKIASVTGAEESTVPSFLLDKTSTVMWAEVDPDCMNGGSVNAAVTTGSSPPALTVTGTGIRAMRLVVEVQSVSGSAGTLRWSGDGGRVWTEQGVPFATVGQTIALPTASGATSLGWSLVFPSGTYSVGQTWYFDSQPTTWGCPGYVGLTATYGTPQWTPVSTAFGSSTMAPVASSGPWGIGRQAWTGSSSTKTAFQATGLSLPAANGYGILVVGMLDTQVAAKTMWGSAVSGGTPILYASSSSQLRVYDGTANTAITVNALVPHCYVLDYRAAAATSTIYVDGVVGATLTSGGITMTGLSLGYDATETYLVGGTWASVAVLNRSPTADEQLAYCRRAASKWGTPQ